MELLNSADTHTIRTAREWPYKNVKPRIIAEELLEDSTSIDLKVYKLMCFNGKVKCTFVCSERSENLKVTFFDNNWKQLPFERHYPASSSFIPKPKTFNMMIELAEELSSGIPFVRVDFYEVDAKIYFGELTFYPGCGFEEFTPDEWDYKLGKLIKLPRKRVQRMRLEMSLKEIQSEVNEILKVTIDVCNKNNITYYCQAGTVLGAIRHKGAIPWDYDADIIIPNNEIDFFVQCCLRDLPREYWIDYHTAPTGGYLQFPRIGKKGYSTDHLHLDVFQLIGLPNDRHEQLKMISEAEQYRQEMNIYKDGLTGILVFLKHGKIKLAIKSIIRHIKRDTSFQPKMEELCSRYPYKEANYVMNPFGRYREKIYSKKKYMEQVKLFHIPHLKLEFHQK